MGIRSFGSGIEKRRKKFFRGETKPFFHQHFLTHDQATSERAFERTAFLRQTQPEKVCVTQRKLPFKKPAQQHRNESQGCQQIFDFEAKDSFISTLFNIWGRNFANLSLERGSRRKRAASKETLKTEGREKKGLLACPVGEGFFDPFSGLSNSISKRHMNYEMWRYEKVLEMIYVFISPAAAAICFLNFKVRWEHQQRVRGSKSSPSSGSVN